MSCMHICFGNNSKLFPKHKNMKKNPIATIVGHEFCSVSGMKSNSLKLARQCDEWGSKLPHMYSIKI